MLGKMLLGIYVIFVGGFDFLISVFAISDFSDIDRIAFVIMSQDNSYHTQVARLKKDDLGHQLKSLNKSVEKDMVFVAPTDFPGVLGYWTIVPLFENILKLSNWTWVFFIEETTEVNVKQLYDVISKYDSDKMYFLGYALKDEQSTIIHHYDRVDEPQVVLYPHFSAGFLVSRALLKKASQSKKEKYSPSFSIDAKYELAKFLLQSGTQTKLKHEPRLCLHKEENNCASWVPDAQTDCTGSVSIRKVFFAVKTFHKYHKDRVQVVKTTWASDTELITFFSDIEDPTVPTVDIGIENVASGHCAKTLAIIQHVYNLYKEIDWLVIADDDTLLSVSRLLKLLSCYNSSESIALGERYGYKTTSPHGYDYLTGGAGMVFSKSLMKKIVLTCGCPSNDAPDDMILGMCLREMEIPIIHSSGFHQARPDDYSPAYLQHYPSISFHKHWMVDPHDIYETYLNELSKKHSTHTEL